MYPRQSVAGLMLDDGGIHCSVNHHDLPIAAIFLKNHRVDTLYLIGSLEHVVEADPPAGLPAFSPQIGDG